MSKKESIATQELEELNRLKRLVIVAMFSDNQLMGQLVLKGGNAIDLIHPDASMRSSVDFDFSMEKSFPKEEIERVKGRIERALKDTVRPEGYEVFDIKMQEQPRGLTPDMADFWGGYSVEFKVVEKKLFDQHAGNLEHQRKRAVSIGGRRRFLIDISSHERTTGKARHELDGYTIFVYTPEMMVCEKIRAICQQMAEYGPVVKRHREGSARARDFLDIHTLIQRFKVDVTAGGNLRLLTEMFEAKRVPLELLSKIKDTREFHERGFSDVRATVKPGTKLQEFGFYFEYVSALAEKVAKVRQQVHDADALGKRRR